MSTETIKVSSIDGLFDEKSEALSCNISYRTLCLTHKWINASLHFERDKFFVSMEAPAKENFNREWGMGYGGMRYCRNCKLIDCIHLWDEKKHYEIEQGKYYSLHHDIGHCRICERRILLVVWGDSHPDQSIWTIIHDACRATNRPSVDFNSGYGSAWFSEFPIQVCDVRDSHGDEAALAYAKQILLSGDLCI